MLQRDNGVIRQRLPRRVTLSARGAIVDRMAGSTDEAPLFEVAEDLGGHHRVGGSVVCELALCHVSIDVEPGRRCEKHELDMGELEWLECCPLDGLPPRRPARSRRRTLCQSP